MKNLETVPTICRRCARSKTAASNGASEPMAPLRINICHLRPCTSWSPAKWRAALRSFCQTIGREDALIAHTRKERLSGSFQENSLGASQPGKLADLLVLDRDYLIIPADQIRNIKPIMTMVGGRMVYVAVLP